jgi:hypothetical protein
LNTPDKAFGNENTEGVVHRLERDGADLRADRLGHIVGRDVRTGRHGPQDGQSLGRDLNATLTKERCRINRHGRTE